MVSSALKQSEQAAGRKKVEGGGKKEIGDDERLKVEEGGGGDYCRDRSSAEDGTESVSWKHQQEIRGE